MKKIFLVVVSLVCFGVSGQGCVDVKLKYQKASNLCWAACIEMIVNYHGVTTYQGDSLTTPLTQFRLSQIKSSNAGSPSTIRESEVLACVDTLYLGTFTTPMPSNPIIDKVNKDYSPSFGGKMQELDYLFSKIGFYSTQDNTFLDWEHSSTEITNCKPYIMTISKHSQPGRSNYNSHAVVVKGYWSYVDSLGVSTRFIVVLDPWLPGLGEVYSLNFERLRDTSNFVIPIEYVHNIIPKNKYPCSMCDTNRTQSPCINQYRNIRETFSISQDRLNAILNDITDTTAYTVKVYDLSHEKLKSVNLDNQLKVEGLKTHAILSEVVSKDRVYSILYQKDRNNNWQLVKIGTNRYPESVKVRIGNNNTFKLSNSNTVQKNEGAIPYEYVRYDAFYQTYFRFKKDGNYYLALETANSLLGISALSEKKVLKNLSKLTKMENTSPILQGHH